HIAQYYDSRITKTPEYPGLINTVPCNKQCGTDSIQRIYIQKITKKAYVDACSIFEKELIGKMGCGGRI
ncbi:MAG TPA: hypothetical protein DEQ29_09645, partial [Escherichia coli]|nr:hypothetical protein [Escherichia coli]